MRGRILIIDDDRSMCELLVESLGRRGFLAHWAANGADGLAKLETDDIDVVVTDLNMAGMDGLELCKRVVAARPDVPVVVITAFGSLETAIGGIRAGAYDFLTKPLEVDALAFALDRAVQHRSLRAEVRRLREAVAAHQRFEGLIGESPPMQRMFDVLDRVAELDVTVMLTGESGTGKELVARALHARGPRVRGPFVAINCAAMPEALLESELFGFVRGAFTDARAARTGLFFQADGGTLFLDEVAELPMSLQPKLLRALQERVVRPLGADREQPFDVRLVVATNRDLEAEVEAGRFREDLFYRINVIHVDVPALRGRGGDILLLAQHFVERFAARMGKRVQGLSGPAAERLLAYEWPGNVRELQNCMERAVALTRYDQITIEDLPDRVRDWKPSRLVLATEDPETLLPMDEVERRYILKVLGAVRGNKTSAARVLGLDRKTLYRKLERWGVKDEEPVE